MAITEGQWRELALRDEEYALIVRRLGREPSPVELGMFGALWSEHCGYKHSRPHLRQLPTTGPVVVQGPGENAGAVDIGDGLAAVFKVESHNHPSAVEPYQGAATGVGGIVRDIFTMGARPIALLNSLRFGPLGEGRNRYLFEHVVAGIGGYGNCLGIPTVGGELFFDPSYSENPIVNAMCVGIARIDGIVRAKASGLGNLIVLVGAETGRDGVHGATFASVDDPETSHRGVIQVGNPFLEKQLMEACLELLQGDAVVAMQDLGAAGLTSALVECASRGDVGAEIDVALVPRRDENMTPYEVMLSESQERMLLVTPPSRLADVQRILRHWSLNASAIGTITEDGQVRVREGESVVADLPALLLTEGCPTYEPEAAESPEVAVARSADYTRIRDLRREEVIPTLLDLLQFPNIGSARPVFEQYDHTILTNTLAGPGEADAAVVRIKATDRAIAVALDCNPRYCGLDPYNGTRLAVAEVTRNVSCTGATPLGITNCLNFGNPERPNGAWQLREAVRGLADACRALETPVVSGNVSLYNETNERPILPTPVVGCVGVIPESRRHATLAWQDNDEVFLLGHGEPSLGGSEYLARCRGQVLGHLPTLCLERERAVQSLTRRLVATGVVRTAHDCGLGGLAVALAEMTLASGLGFHSAAFAENHGEKRIDEVWFGEAPSRVIVAVPKAESAALRANALEAGVPVVFLGHVSSQALNLGPFGSCDLNDVAFASARALEQRPATTPLASTGAISNDGT